MARTQEQVGQVAFKLFEALSKVKFGLEELKSLGEEVYANDPEKAANDKKDFVEQSKERLGKVRPSAIAKLFKACLELDGAFPLPDAAALEAAQSKAKELEGERDALQAQAVELQAKVVRLQNDRELLRAERKELGDTIEGLKAKLAQPAQPNGADVAKPTESSGG